MDIASTLTHFLLAAQRRRSGLTRKEITISGGLRYVYLEGGQGEPLLMLHGFGANKDNFTPIARYLVPHYRVIIPDHIGFGESSHPQELDYAPPAQAARLRVFMDALGVNRFHLAGHSMGGQISLIYTSLYSGDVKTLWLIDPGGVLSAPKSERQKIVAEGQCNPLMARNEEEFAAVIRFVMSKPPRIPRFMLKALARERTRNFDLEHRIYNGDVAYPVEPHVAGLQTATLIIWGAEDRSHNPAGADILHGLLPRSQVILLPGVGHMPMVEDPERCASEYLKFRQSSLTKSDRPFYIPTPPAGAGPAICGAR
jgi:pimeloyl-ACP methyl ester carboxylesterase